MLKQARDQAQHYLKARTSHAAIAPALTQRPPRLRIMKPPCREIRITPVIPMRRGRSTNRLPISQPWPSWWRIRNGFVLLIARLRCRAGLLARITPQQCRIRLMILVRQSQWRIGLRAYFRLCNIRLVVLIARLRRRWQKPVRNIYHPTAEQ